MKMIHVLVGIIWKMLVILLTASIFVKLYTWYILPTYQFSINVYVVNGILLTIFLVKECIFGLDLNKKYTHNDMYIGLLYETLSALVTLSIGWLGLGFLSLLV